MDHLCDSVICMTMDFDAATTNVIRWAWKASNYYLCVRYAGKTGMFWCFLCVCVCVKKLQNYWSEIDMA